MISIKLGFREKSEMNARKFSTILLIALIMFPAIGVFARYELPHMFYGARARLKRPSQTSQRSWKKIRKRRALKRLISHLSTLRSTRHCTGEFPRRARAEGGLL